MIINREDLAKDSLRRQGLEIMKAGYEAINIEKIVRRKVSVVGTKLKVMDKEYNLANYNRIFMVAFGKGSAQFAWTMGKILDCRLDKGIALDVREPKMDWWETAPEIDFLVGTHPLPSRKNIQAVGKITNLVEQLTENDLLLVLVTGGGSALLCSTEEEMQEGVLVTKSLTKMGVPIDELNTVRKHLGFLKGGGLAKLAYPAKVVSLIASDVCGGAEMKNNLTLIASGPTVRDDTTKIEAKKVLEKYNLAGDRFSLKETTKEDMFFKRVDNLLLVCNQDALIGMTERANELGFKAKIVSSTMQGEAQNVLKDWFDKIQAGEVWIAGGETTVKIKGGGEGGRNQEVVLGALDYAVRRVDWSEDWLVSSLASDGMDNTEAAGALGDELLEKEAREKDLNIKKYLEDNDPFNFFKQVGGLIYAEPTSFNVSDLMFLMRDSK